MWCRREQESHSYAEGRVRVLQMVSGNVVRYLPRIADQDLRERARTECVDSCVRRRTWPPIWRSTLSCSITHWP